MTNLSRARLPRGRTAGLGRATAVCALVFALQPGVGVAEAAWDEQRYTRLLSELRCLVCQNQSLADSDAGLASDLRAQVREMLEGGASDEEIKIFMTERYGDFVLYDPPLAPRTYVLWAAPFVLLALTVLLLFRHVAGRRPPGPPEA